MIRFNQTTKPILSTALLLLLPALFAIITFLLIITQSIQYYSIANKMTRNYETKTASTYLTEQIKYHNQSGVISITEFYGIPALSFLKENHHQTLLYVYDDYLRELTVSNSSLISPDEGQKIVEMKALSITKYTDILYCFTITDSTGLTIPIFVSLNAQ